VEDNYLKRKIGSFEIEFEGLVEAIKSLISLLRMKCLRKKHWIWRLSIWHL